MYRISRHLIRSPWCTIEGLTILSRSPVSNTWPLTHKIVKMSMSSQDKVPNNDERVTKNRLSNLKLWYAIEQIRNNGHLLAQLDPLCQSQIADKSIVLWCHPLIEELKKDNNLVDTTGLLFTREAKKTVSSLIEECERIYTHQGVGVELDHLESHEEKEWLAENWERLSQFEGIGVNEDQLAKLMLECEAFDHFLATKYTTTKRYGCEGAEPMILIFDEILKQFQFNNEAGPTDIIIGMPHRGRLNLLACLLQFDPAAIFSKVSGQSELDLEDAWTATGDVLSHLSTNISLMEPVGSARDGSLKIKRSVNVTLLPNPSHLEVASPMAVGTARGRALNMYFNRTTSPKLKPALKHQSPFSIDPQSSNYHEAYSPSILPIQVHGDASIAGQGIIQETLQTANLPQFSVCGSIHLIVNNQIGYTTAPSQGRSSRYCTDILKTINAPAIHVNGDNINGVIKSTRLALAYRQKFHKDIAIDLICYRRHGHNELDEPSFTQPVMYEAIRRRKSIPRKYGHSIGMDDKRMDEIGSKYKDKLNKDFQRVTIFKPDNNNYRNFEHPSLLLRDSIQKWKTGCNLELLRNVGLASVVVPANFKMHSNLERVLKKDRLNKFSYGGSDGVNFNLAEIPIDWALSEILAFGSLLYQGHNVRLAGQDVARGTFSTRHATLFDQDTQAAYIPLNHMFAGQRSQLEVANTVLSEEAAMAYESAFSMETCELTIWEAQFGDFFNTAQSIIDVLVSSSETKWLKQSPLTLLLPHGLDGAGPEHSNSHLERFLTVSNSSMDTKMIDTEANTNWSICYPTMPHQYFHLLRRQIVRPFRKPLVVMAPKILFRHPDCLSRFSMFSEASHFEPILDDSACSNSKHLVDTVVLCSGKVWFDLNQVRNEKQMNNVAIIRLEELCPFPVYQIKRILNDYKNRKLLVWFQEEHKNQGAYSFVEARMRNLLGMRMTYIGRAESALPAVGSSTLHKKELGQIMEEFQSLKRSI